MFSLSLEPNILADPLDLLKICQNIWLNQNDQIHWIVERHHCLYYTENYHQQYYFNQWNKWESRGIFGYKKAFLLFDLQAITSYEQKRQSPVLYLDTFYFNGIQNLNAYFYHWIALLNANIMNFVWGQSSIPIPKFYSKISENFLMEFVYTTQI